MTKDKNKTGTEVATAPSIFGVADQAMDVTSLAARAKEVADADAMNTKAYMSFSGKTGELKYGRDKADVTADQLFAVDVSSFSEGFTCWKGGKPLHKRMANIYNEKPIPTPDEDEDGPFEKSGEGWQATKSFMLREINGAPTPIEFSSSSMSGVNSISDILSKFAERSSEGQPCWPIITIVKEKFESNGYTNYKPVMTVAHWLTTEQMTAMGSGKALAEVLEE